MTNAETDDSLKFPQSVQDEIRQYIANLTDARSALKAGKSSARSRQIVSDIDTMLERISVPGFSETLSTIDLCDVSDRSQSLVEMALAHGRA